MTGLRKIHDGISDAYTQAIQNSDSPGSHSKEQSILTLAKGQLSSLAGYKDDQINDVPSSAIENSFGCGNPVALSGIQAGQTVLDLGCGAGLDLLLIAEKVGVTGQVIGIDMTDGMLALAQKNIAESGHKNIKLFKGLIEDLPFSDNSIDWIISNCVVNLSPHKVDVFQEMLRVLRPNGEISIADIVVKELPEWLQLNAQMYFACIAGAISEDDYIKGLERSGFIAIQVSDRLVYDQSMIRGILKANKPFKAGPSSLSQSGLDYIIEKVGGHIWSARFRGRKPDLPTSSLSLDASNVDTSQNSDLTTIQGSKFGTCLKTLDSQEGNTMVAQVTVKETKNNAKSQKLEGKSKEYWDLLAFMISNSISGEIIATENYALLVPLLDDIDEKIEASHQSYIESKHVQRLLILADRLNLPSVKAVVEPEWFSIRKNYNAAVARKDVAACFIAQDIMIESLAITAYKGLVGVGNASTDPDTSMTVEKILEDEIEHFEIGIERLKQLLQEDPEKTHDALIWAHHRILPDVINMVQDGCTYLCDELGIQCGSFGLEEINASTQNGREDMIRRYVDTLGRIGFDKKVVNSLLSGLTCYSANVPEPLPQSSPTKRSCC